MLDWSIRINFCCQSVVWLTARSTGCFGASGFSQQPSVQAESENTVASDSVSSGESPALYSIIKRNLFRHSYLKFTLTWEVLNLLWKILDHFQQKYFVFCCWTRGVTPWALPVSCSCPCTYSLLQCLRKTGDFIEITFCMREQIVPGLLLFRRRLNTCVLALKVLGVEAMPPSFKFCGSSAPLPPPHIKAFTKAACTFCMTGMITANCRSFFPWQGLLKRLMAG